MAARAPPTRRCSIFRQGRRTLHARHGTGPSSVPCQTCRSFRNLRLHRGRHEQDQCLPAYIVTLSHLHEFWLLEPPVIEPLLVHHSASCLRFAINESNAGMLPPLISISPCGPARTIRCILHSSGFCGLHVSDDFSAASRSSTDSGMKCDDVPDGCALRHLTCSPT